MKINKESILSILKSLDKEKYKINKIGLFGSFAREEETGSSDVDIFVEFKEEANVFRDFYDVKYDLEDIFQKKVDLISSDNFDYEYKLKEVKEYKEKVKEEILANVIYV
ncbi:MAG: nucleotidyltransferase family protein [Fusobacteriaceae bacterium]